jgi:hypothetical protein
MYHHLDRFCWMAADRRSNCGHSHRTERAARACRLARGRSPHITHCAIRYGERCTCSLWISD